MAQSLPTGTVTFFFSDIEGSTRLLEELGDTYAEVLEIQQRVVREAVQRNHGIELGTEGDSFFCVFSSASDAVRAAADAQRALVAATWPSGRAVQVRIGLHTGEAKLGGDNYVGLDVHRAARISAAAHGGQILVSEGTRRLVTDGGSPGFKDLGEHRLKDLTEPVRLFELAAEGLPTDFPPPLSLSSSVRNLPMTMTSFVGRHDEIASLRNLLQSERLITITGPGGVGKTRLAIEIGRLEASTLTDGVAYAPLAGLAADDDVAPEVAHALEVPERATEPVEKTLADHLRDRSVLLILDNCEHVGSEVARLVGDWIRRSPGPRFLTTSREPLGIAGEQLFRVEPLPVPATDSGNSADLLELDIVRLFGDRARAVNPRFDPESHIDDIVAIGRRLDGIPLAVELAAARTSALTPAEILARLDGRFKLLRGGLRASLSPHTTLEAAIDWSHDLLSEPEAILFRRLSIFRGGFTLEAAEAVCSDGAVKADRILDLLERLIGKSLVTMAIEGGRSRFRIYEPIRTYAEARLRDSGEWSTVVAAHETHFVKWAKARASELRGSAQLEALDALEGDHLNLQAILSRSWERGDASTTLELAATLTWFWYLHGHFLVGERWSELLLSDPETPPTRSSVRMRIGAAEFDYRLGNHGRAEVRLREAIDGARAIGSQSLEMWAYSHRATNEALKLSFELAAEYARASLTRAERIGAMGAVAWATFLLVGIEGWRALHDGPLDGETASRIHAQLAPIVAAARGLGDRNITGHVLEVSGFFAHAASDQRVAWYELGDALKDFGDLGNPGCSAHCLEVIAMVTAEADPTASAAMLAAADSVRETVGIPPPLVESTTADLARAKAETALTPEEFKAAWETGHGLALAEAVALGRAAIASAPG